MQLLFAQSEYTMEKNLQVFNMNVKEQETYDKLYQQIGNALARTCSLVLVLFSNLCEYIL